IQLLLIIHVLKTGRDRYWIWLLIFIPLLGGAAYLLIEVFPGLAGDLRVRRAARGVRRAVDPGSGVRPEAADWERSANAETGRRYAAALIDAGRPAEALDVLDQVLNGLFEHDPALLLLKARAEFALDRHGAAVTTLERLNQENPDLRSPEGHLLYARALEAEGKTQEAIDEYQAVADYYPGAEARYRLGEALRRAGRDQLAREVFQRLVKDGQHAPRHFQREQREWLNAARKALD
ncbi:MAG: tetratricopeptide repeat protein, partial [Xanthomonadales bacterium]|nr:tetratricopeptide repeat protein [Xanthomonadales bacterium]